MLSHHHAAPDFPKIFITIPRSEPPHVEVRLFHTDQASPKGIVGTTSWTMTTPDFPHIIIVHQTRVREHDVGLLRPDKALI